MGGRLELGRLPGRVLLKPSHAICRVDREVLSGAILSHRIQDPSAEELVARRHMGHNVADRPRLAESGLPPTVGWHGVDRLEIPARRLSEFARLSLHSSTLPPS